MQQSNNTSAAGANIISGPAVGVIGSGGYGGAINRDVEGTSK